MLTNADNQQVSGQKGYFENEIPAKTKGQVCVLMAVRQAEGLDQGQAERLRCLGLPVILVQYGGQAGEETMSRYEGIPWWALTSPKSKGKGAALNLGMEKGLALGYAYALTLDEDEPIDVHELVRFVPTTSLGRSMRLGVRTSSAFSYHTGKAGLLRLSNLLFWLETGVQCQDSRSSVRFYPLAAMRQLTYRFHHRAWEIEALVRAVWGGLKIKEVTLKSYQVRDEPTPIRKLTDSLRLVGVHAYLIGRRIWPWPFKAIVVKAPEPWPQTWKARLRWLWFRYFWRMNATPAEIAWSVGVGLFCGLLPNWGTHSLVALYLAQRLHLNKLLVLASSLVSLSPLLPLFLYLELLVGHGWLTGQWQTKLSWERLTWAGVHAKMQEMLLGSVVVALVTAVLSGLLLYLGLIWVRRLRYRTLSAKRKQRMMVHES